MAGSTTELIKEKLDIVEFLKGYLSLHPAGKNFKALCPFHKERTPSFMVSPERQSWHCFGCALGGDIFAFLMRYENVEFGEALRILAEKAGVELRRLNPAEYKYTGLLHDLNAVAKEFFKEELKNSKPAEKYLVERGLKQETIEEFELGWAPNEPEALSLHLLNLGYSPTDILQAGLVFKTDRGMVIDRFRGRVMFPIHSHFGKVVGFTGRILPQLDKGDAGKYVNSPETPIFNKSKLLYGFWKSKNFIREAKSVFLVEGQMDFLMSWQAGVKHAVASSGTALTQDHLRVLRRLTDEIVLSFDTDEAGWQAGERAIDLAEANDFGVKVVIFDKFKDPAEAAQADPENLKKAITRAKPATQFYFEKYLRPGEMKKDRREDLRNLRMVLGKIKNITSPVEQSFWLKELARHTGIEERVLSEESEKLKTKGEAQLRKDEEVAASMPRNFSRRELISQRLLSVVYMSNQFHFAEDSVSYLVSPYDQAFTALKSGEKSSSNPILDELLNLIVLRSEELMPEEAEDLKKELFKEYIKERRQELSLSVKKAEESGDEVGLKAALEELNSLPVISS